MVGDSHCRFICREGKADYRSFFGRATRRGPGCPLHDRGTSAAVVLVMHSILITVCGDRIQTRRVPRVAVQAHEKPIETGLPGVEFIHIYVIFALRHSNASFRGVSQFVILSLDLTGGWHR